MNHVNIYLKARMYHQELQRKKNNEIGKDICFSEKKIKNKKARNKVDILS